MVQEARVGDPDLDVASIVLLIIDDDDAIHAATRFSLAGVRLLDRPLELLHAMSAEEGLAIIEEHPEVALVLLDIAMEHPTAGLDLISEIRRRADFDRIRIIVRTGRPQLAPVTDVVRRFDVAGYLEKSVTSRAELISTLTSAARWNHQCRYGVIPGMHPNRPSSTSVSC